MSTVQKKNESSKVVSKNSCLTLDAIGKRYGKLPSELLKLDINDYTLNLVVANTAIKEEEKQRKEAERKSKLVPKRRR